MSLATLALAILQMMALAGGQILWKRGIDDAGGFMSGGESMVGSMAKLATNPAFLAGCVLYLAATLLWFYLLARNDLSLIYPVLSLTFVLASLGGWLILGEAMSPQRLLGIAVIAAGVLVVTRS